jgi:N-acetylmuramoyl-L-alanine amidase
VRQAAGAALLTLTLGVLSACGSGIPARTAAPPTGSAAARTLRPAGGTSDLAGKVIVIDPGHNGRNGAHPEIINKQVDVLTEHKECDTTGAEAHGYNESAFNWDAALRLEKILKADGAKVILTRSSDGGVGPCITERAGIGNRAHADAALSIHADGVGASDHGFHIIEPALIKGHTDKIVGPSKKLGLALRDAYRAGTGVPYSNYAGTQAINVRNDLGGLNLSTVPKVFIECGNMPNAGDFAKLHDPAFRQKIAQSLAAGFGAYFSG